MSRKVFLKLLRKIFLLSSTSIEARACRFLVAILTPKKCERLSGTWRTFQLPSECSRHYLLFKIPCAYSQVLRTTKLTASMP